MPEYLVRFEVRQAWKGVEAGPLEILTTESGGMCGFDFKVGTLNPRSPIAAATTAGSARPCAA